MVMATRLYFINFWKSSNYKLNVYNLRRGREEQKT
jgi:hypothetical protein